MLSSLIRDILDFMQPISSLQPYFLIQDIQALEKFCSNVTDYLAIDTEFSRHTTYWPQASLIQLGTKNHIAIIDLLSPPKSLDSLSYILKNNKIIKIFHAPRGDIEILIQCFDTIPSPIFDTQLAAYFVGLGEQISYTTLVHNLLNKKLRNSHQKADWLKRPIIPEQIAYAIEDILYLEPCYKKLCNMLHKKRSWYDSEVLKFQKMELYRPSAKNIWKKLQQYTTTAYSQHVLQTLCIFREQYAIKQNKPRAWIIPDKKLILILHVWIEYHPTFLEFRQQITSFFCCKNKPTNSQIKSLFIQLNSIPFYIEPLNKPNIIFNEGLFNVLKRLRKNIASQYQLPINLLCTQEELRLLSMEQIPKNLEVLQSWRYEIFGKLILDFLSDRHHISYSQENNFILSKCLI